ncbi:IPT/TIG domain-containing protein [bacterium]|nr:IPT/TIG domain-containing protein [bacterium]
MRTPVRHPVFPLASMLLLASLCASLAACAPEDEGPPVTGVPQPTTAPPSGEVGGSVGGDPNGGASPAPTPAPITLSISSPAAALAVPRQGGGGLFPSSHLFQTVSSSPSAVITWLSSAPSIVSVDQVGRVQALRAGSAIITASIGAVKATASVTVQEKARLLVAAQNPPAVSHSLVVTVRNDQGTAIATSTPADLTQLGNLSVEASAKDSLGKVLAFGRAEGVNLLPNEQTSLAIPLNAPRLDVVQSGGPGAQILATGAGFQRWVKLQDGVQTFYEPTVTAAFGGQATTVSVLNDSQALVTVPAGLSADLPLTLTVDSCAVSTPFKRVASLRILPFPDPLPLQASYRFNAEALDAQSNPLPGVELSWEASEKGAGTMVVNGLFQDMRVGTSIITVRSGTVSATATVTVQ